MAAAGFHTTHWTIVLKAGGLDGPEKRDAQAKFCEAYWFPLYAYIRRQGSSHHEAEDLTQEFFRQFLERQSLAHAKPASGRFRSFLLACLKNFLTNEWQRGQAQRRGGGRVHVPLEPGDAESRYQLGPADPHTPESVFDRQWALTVLERTMEALRQQHSSSRKRSQFEELQGFLPGGTSGTTREELAQKRGVSVGAIDVAIHRIRREFGKLLREEVARTVSSDAEIDGEIRDLKAILGS